MESVIREPVALFLAIMAVMLITPLLSERVHLPGIVGLIIGGMLIGPYGVRLLETGDVIELLSTVGLIYLMFSAGLEVNLSQFNRVRNKAVVFGVLTFSVPLAMGTALGRVIGLDWPGAILLGSAVSSHTLIAFPILVRLGVVTNEAVSVTVGATVFTDISAFLVLAVIAGEKGGGSGSALTLLMLMVGYAALILLIFPRAGKWFFRYFTNQTVDFQFVLVALFVAALLAEVIGMHPVVGAFLAGLAINSALPHHSPVVSRVLFMGEAFFIPVFLIYSGMITDPLAFVRDSSTLLTGVLLTGMAYLSKWLAAWGAARIFGYSRDEMWAVWGLSQAQAAVTLPTILVGMQIGLFSGTILNATMLMILFTSITSPMLVQRFGERLAPSRPAAKERSLFERILVPITNPKTQEHLITLAGILSRSAKGTLLPLHVAREINGHVSGLETQRQLMEAEILRDPETHIQPVRRVDNSISKGILRSAIENDATLIVMGWRGKPTLRQSMLGTVLDEVVWKAPVPVLVGRLNHPINGMQRVALIIPPDCFGTEFARDILQMVATIAQDVNVPLLILAASSYHDLIQATLSSLGLEQPVEVAALEKNVVRQILDVVHPNDLMVVVTTGSRARFSSSLGHLPEQLAAATSGSMVVIHYAPQPYPAAH